jgi:hypothetical protein
MWPAQLAAIRPPEFQVTELFKQSSDRAGPLRAAVHTAHATFRAPTLNAVIELKVAERDFLHGGLMSTAFEPRLRKLVKTRYEVHQRDFGYIDDPDSVDGVHKVARDTLERKFQQTMESVGLWATRVIDIVRARHVAEQRRSEAKHAMKAAADVEMGDPAAEKEALENRILRLVTAKLRRAGLNDKVRPFDSIVDRFYQTHFSLGPETVDVETGGFAEEEGWQHLLDHPQKVRRSRSHPQGLQDGTSQNEEGFEARLQGEREAEIDFVEKSTTDTS